MELTKRFRNLAGAITVLAFSVITLVFLFGNSHFYQNKEKAVPDSVAISPRLQLLFEKTKVLCFGRYVIEVPREAQLIIGDTTIRNQIEVLSGGMENAKHHADEKFKQLKREEPTAEVNYNGLGPIADTWQVRYFADKYKKERKALFFNTYLSKGEHTFLLGDAVSKGENESLVADRQHSLASSLRLRPDEDDIPAESGFCIDHGFIATDHYADQELIKVGIYLPTLSDVTFSISSNKDAYADLNKNDFDKMAHDELALLARIKNAQKTQGALYPKRDVLREGKRNVQHWNGEESLIRRPDGTHDFEWAFVGTPTDVANPAEFHVVMFSKVKANMVGAANKASVNDDEAVALWDKLLSSLKFRVKVPGAPEGSYLLPKTKAESPTPN